MSFLNQRCYIYANPYEIGPVPSMMLQSQAMYIYSVSIYAFPLFIPFYYIVILFLCRACINIIRLCKPLSKLDLPTLHKRW